MKAPQPAFGADGVKFDVPGIVGDLRAFLQRIRIADAPGPATRAQRRERAVVIAAAGSQPAALRIEAGQRHHDRIDARRHHPSAAARLVDAEAIRAQRLSDFPFDEVHALPTQSRQQYATARTPQLLQQRRGREFGAVGEIQRDAANAAALDRAHQVIGASLRCASLVAPRDRGPALAQRFTQLRLVQGFGRRSGDSRLCRHSLGTLRRGLKWVPQSGFRASRRQRGLARPTSFGSRGFANRLKGLERSSNTAGDTVDMITPTTHAL